jgi:hypothetical protein
MDEQALLGAARLLSTPTPQAAQEYTSLVETLVTTLNNRVLADPRTDALIGGATNRSVMTNNNHNHALFISSLLADYKAETFVETVAWVLKAYPARGFKIDFFPFVLDEWEKVIRLHLSPASVEAVLPFYRFMRDHIEPLSLLPTPEEHP